MSVEDGTKRFNAEIPIDLDRRLKKCIPWGTQAESMRKLLEAFADAVEKKGAVVVHHLLAGEIELTIITPDSGVHQMDTSDKHE